MTENFPLTSETSQIFPHKEAQAIDDTACAFNSRAVFLMSIYRLVGPVVKAPVSRAEDPGFESRLRRDFSRARVIPVTSKLALQWPLPCQAPGGIGSVLGLVGPVSVYCDRLR